MIFRLLGYPNMAWFWLGLHSCIVSWEYHQTPSMSFCLTKKFLVKMAIFVYLGPYRSIRNFWWGMGQVVVPDKFISHYSTRKSSLKLLFCDILWMICHINFKYGSIILHKQRKKPAKNLHLDIAPLSAY